MAYVLSVAAFSLLFIGGACLLELIVVENILKRSDQ